MSRESGKCKGQQEIIVVRVLPLPNSGEEGRKIAATKSSVAYENLKRQVKFQSEERFPCETSWQKSICSGRVRNRRIKDAPFSRPTCCVDIFNHLRDRSNAKKLKLYNLEKRIRPAMREQIQPEEEEICKSEFNNVPCIEVLECYDVNSESGDDEDEFSDTELEELAQDTTQGLRGQSGAEDKLQKILTETYPDMFKPECLNIQKKLKEKSDYLRKNRDIKT